MKKSAVESAHVITAVPDPDRTRAFAAEVAGLVPSACWAFARYDVDGEAAEIVLDDRHNEQFALQLDWLKAEKAALSRESDAAPRLLRTRAQIAPYRFGLTLAYGSGERISGLLLVLRKLTDPQFTKEEIALLGQSLEDGSRILSRLGVFDGEQTARERASQRALPAQYVLNRDLSIEYSFQPVRPNDALAEMLNVNGSLPPAIESAVRTAVAGWSDDPSTWTEGFAIPLPFIIVRVVPLAGNGGLRIGVLIERFQARNSLSWAARRFSMSARELQVLTLMLQGHGTTEIASTLNIAESTAHDHVKRLLIKTKSHNRVELAAKALGWRAL